MVELRTLGLLDLRDAAGAEIRSVLQQPKRLALLAFLTISAPRRYHRRDSLLAMFWPELDEEHARAALRRSLHFLRGALGPGSIEGRGEEEVGVRPEQLWCDAVAFEEALRSGNPASALELYQGNLLEGFHVSESPAFDDWLDGERSRLRGVATLAAWSLADAADRRHCYEEAARWGRQAFDLNHDDEEALHRFLRLLDHLGDRAAAIATYEEFVRRLTRDGLEPESETRALMEAIRARPRPMNVEGRVRSGVSETLAQPAPSIPPEFPVTPTEPETQRPFGGPPDTRRRRRWGVPGAGAAMLGILGLAALSTLSHHRATLDPRRVLVAPFENRTGKASLDPLGFIAADWIARSLSETRLVQVVDASAALSSGSSVGTGGIVAGGEKGIARLGVKSRAGTVVVGSYYRQRDTLYFEAKVIDAVRHDVLSALAPAGALETQPLTAVEILRQRIMVALAFRLDSSLGNFPTTSHPPTYEAYRHFVEGITLHTKRDYRAAKQEFLQAAASDSAFYAPVIFAALEHFNLALDNSDLHGFATSDSLVNLVAAHREQLSPLEVAILDWLRARLVGDQSAGLVISRRFAQLAPGTLWEYQGAYDALLVNRPAEAVTILARMDPDRGPLRGWMYYWSVLSVAHHLLGEHRRELRIAQRARERYGATLDVLALEMGALAALGRVRELEVRVGEAEMARPAVWATPAVVLMKVGQELQAHGYPDASVRLLNRVLTWYRGRLREERASQISRAEYGEILYSAGQWQAARKIFEELAAENSSAFYHGFLGLLAARQGDSAKAQEISKSLAAVKTPYLFGQVTYVRARIASLLGQRPQAVALLRQAFADGLQYGMHSLHFDPDLVPLRGYPPFEELLRPKGHN